MSRCGESSVSFCITQMCMPEAMACIGKSDDVGFLLENSYPTCHRWQVGELHLPTFLDGRILAYENGWVNGASSVQTEFCPRFISVGHIAGCATIYYWFIVKKPISEKGGSQLEDI